MNETPETAILDADIIAYKAACWADTNKASINSLNERLEFDVNYWTPPGLSRRILAFSCSRKDNFRRAFWPSYKENREGKPKPKHLSLCKEILTSTEKTIHRDGLEADDIIGLGMGSMTMIGVSLDKDLMTCPGWFWNPEKMDFPKLVSVETADYWFHKQWLMGDSTDNIPGIPKIGKVKAGRFLEGVSPANRTPFVMKLYEEKGLDLDYCLAQARCVRILRYSEWDKEAKTPILWTPEWALTPESKRN